MEIRVHKRVFYLFVAVAALVGLLLVYYFFLMPKPMDTYVYKGVPMTFRADLREAAKVPIRPFEDAIFIDTIHPIAKNVTIVFKPAAETENPYYILEEIEVVSKMKIVYDLKGIEIGFNAVPVESYSNLPGKIQNPIIALVHPVYANETAVWNENHVTYISGTTYEDFDRATVRFLMAIMQIELDEDGA